MANSSSGDSVFSRIVRILTAIESDQPALSVSDLARKIDLPVSSTNRIVHGLIESAWISKDEDGKLGLGLSLWELAHRGRSPFSELQSAAKPVMQELQGVIQQNTQLGVLTDDCVDVLFLDCYSQQNSVDTAASIASRLPAHRSSAGLSIIAFAEHERKELFLQCYENEIPLLRDKLLAVKRSGFAVANGLIHRHTSGVSAPIRNRRSAVVAALTIVVPRDAAIIGEAIKPLIAAANQISYSLGWRNIDTGLDSHSMGTSPSMSEVSEILKTLNREGENGHGSS